MRGLILSLVVFVGLTFNNIIFAQAHQSNKNNISERDKDASTQDIWNLPDLPVYEGPYTASWEGLGKLYAVPQWWREAKFGAWSHWAPQSMPERYFMAMGVHHYNLDCYDSKYQLWNSVNVGPKKDIVGIWEKVAREHGMRFGIGFHNTPGRTWGQFMTVRYTSDQNGSEAGVPYDALQTIDGGKGEWWEGMDPVDLYGSVHDKNEPLLSPFANQFMWRVDDAITKYHPDVIYFDEHAGNSQIDIGVRMGLGFLAPQLIANYYNKSLQWNNGKMEAVVNLKGVGTFGNVSKVEMLGTNVEFEFIQNETGLTITPNQVLQHLPGLTDHYHKTFGFFALHMIKAG